ncbi:hypothetical protein BOTBODRAFT_236739 [Botryobasidium botryosum FD-172 SS1]|uniref:RTA1 like protein n=1 Tax=Botryobasidium botryosum (strain FD-172 SS1) TaxID=930990 RepID=A0A067MYL3_BOTB1|nr:hypothetical protein BOTBODRAFT_236739 [Botryobasidium botryosum FD-172 SS1]
MRARIYSGRADRGLSLLSYCPSRTKKVMNSTTAATKPPVHSPYNYVPTFWVCLTFVALFGLSGLLHLFQAFRSRKWWLIPTLVMCAIGEVAGWSGRLWSSQNPPLKTPFVIQTTTTIVAPSFMSTALFIILGRLVKQLGTRYSRLSPKLYAIIFGVIDLTSLFIQALGGDKASNAKTLDGANHGARIMLIGIIIQMVAITFYALLATEFFYRFFKNRPVDKVIEYESIQFDGMEGKYPISGRGRSKPDQSIKLLVVAIALSSFLLYVRAVYRTVELTGGWEGPIIGTQIYFILLDGLPIFLAMLTLNILNPGSLLNRVESSELSPVTSVA